MASASAVLGTKMNPPITYKNYISVIVDGNTLRFDDNDTDGPYQAGCRAADALRTLILEHLSRGGIQVREKLETLIQIYANGEGLIPAKPGGKDMETGKRKFTDFRRGFNQHQPLSVFEDTSVTGPSGAGDTLLKQLKDGYCTQIIVAKPYGPGFHALLQAQRENGTLPAKLTEVMIHPQALNPSQRSYPFTAMPSLAIQELPKQRHTTQNTLTQIPSTQNIPAQDAATQITSTQNIPAQNAPRGDEITQNNLAKELIPAIAAASE